MKTRDASRCFEALDKLCQSPPADQLEKKKRSKLEAHDAESCDLHHLMHTYYHEEIDGQPTSDAGSAVGGDTCGRASLTG